MPSGKVHDQITVVGAALCVPVWYFASPPAYHDPIAGIALVAATLFSGLMLSPDLDLDSSIYRRWGPFRFLWWPYQKLVPHRSPISHNAFIGPVLRVLYFLLLGYLLLRLGTWAANYFLPAERSFDRNALSRGYVDFLLNLHTRYPGPFYMTLLGLFFGTFLHVAADTIGSSLKRKRRH